MFRSRWSCLGFVLACACGGGDTAIDAGADAARPDAGSDAGEPPVVPDQVCPGPGCEDEGDGLLYAGAAAVAITPALSDAEPLTTDVDGDGEFDADDGDVYEDRDGDGVYDAIWLAGFGNARAATAIHDDLWARALALRHNGTTIVFVAIDAVGLFLDDMEPIREAVRDVDVDYVFVSATHGHEARDTIGIWGPTLSESGRDLAYMQRIHERGAQAVRMAVAALRRSHVQYASFQLRDLPGGMQRYVSDVRDPLVIDDEVRILRFVEPGGATISTLVNFGSHPEYWGPDNTELSSDFPHWLRTGIEDGVVTAPPGAEPLAGVGGVCVFINGAVGSQIGPGAVELRTWPTAEQPEREVERETRLAAETFGTQMAYYVLRALGPTGGSTTEETAPLGFRRHRFFVRIQNRQYHIAYQQGLFVRGVYNYDSSRPIRSVLNEPDVLSEVAVIDVGRVQMITAPGELDPVLFLGGYDGSHTPPGEPVVDTSRENPPDLAMAPRGPYLRDLARRDADQVWLLGLTNDFLGYFIPAFDYELVEGVPYIVEAPGSHYEETNSIGIDGWPRVERKLTELLAWQP